MTDESDEATEREPTLERRPGLHWMLDEKAEPTVLSQLEAIALLLLEPERVSPSNGQEKSVSDLSAEVAEIAKRVYEREIGDTGFRIAHAQHMRADKAIRDALQNADEPSIRAVRTEDERLAFLAIDVEMNVRRRLSSQKIRQLREAARERRRGNKKKTTRDHFIDLLCAMPGDGVGIADLMATSTKEKRPKSTPTARFYRPWSAVPGIINNVLRAEREVTPSGALWKRATALEGLQYAIGELVEWFTDSHPEQRATSTFVYQHLRCG
jgi:hypothetical protein